MLDRASAQNAGDTLPISVILVFAIILGPLGGLFGLYVGGWFIGLTGRWLSGRKGSRDKGGDRLVFCSDSCPNPDIDHLARHFRPRDVHSGDTVARFQPRARPGLLGVRRSSDSPGDLVIRDPSQMRG